MSVPSRAAAQPAEDVEVEEDLEEEEEEEEEEEAPAEPRLRAPVAEELAWDEEEEETTDAEDEADEEEDEEEIEEIEDDELPDPERVEERLDGAGTDPTVAPWSTPSTVFELHGYMRMRGEFQDQFSLGRVAVGSGGDAPFDAFIPRDDASVLGGPPSGGCAGAGGSATAPCNQRALAYANMRLRLEPTIHLSDDVRVRMQFDVFDNLVMGSTPEGYGTLYDQGGYANALDVDSYVPLLAFSQTQTPPSAGINSLSDSIVARRAWAEVRNRGLGEIRFGRMGNHWGLGLLANDGRGIDADYQTDVDRIMIITRFFGLNIFGAWDFASEGMIAYGASGNRTGISYDAVRNDDVDQMTFGVARRLTPEETTLTLERHEVVLNGGAYFVYRTQNLTTESYSVPGGTGYDSSNFVRRGFETFTPDLWGQLLWDESGSATPDLRLEFEAVMQIGTIGNIATTSFESSTRRDILSFGFAFEGEYHLLNDQLGIYFNAGYASGDADAEGLTLNTAYRQRETSGGAPDTTISTMAFNPAYRVDLIFWRNIMRSIAGAYYFRPGLSYDFIRDSFGQLLGARADVVWSRASEPIQTWGNQADLGVEIDAQVYYRSEDGPDLLDGFYASLQYGIFFPLAGVGYLPGTGTPGTGGQNAQTLRLILGVSY